MTDNHYIELSTRLTICSPLLIATHSFFWINFLLIEVHSFFFYVLKEWSMINAVFLCLNMSFSPSLLHNLLVGYIILLWQLFILDTLKTLLGRCTGPTECGEKSDVTSAIGTSVVILFFNDCCWQGLVKSLVSRCCVWNCSCYSSSFLGMLLHDQDSCLSWF